MRAEDFEHLYNLEENFWWFAAMRRISDAIVRDELQRGSLDILDAGCGTGYNVKHYEAGGHRVFAFDIVAEAIAGVQKRGSDKLCQASVTEIPYRSEVFDLVFSFDVLEQLTPAEGLHAVKEMCRVLRPGGHLFLRVPAFEWMRSSHDEDLRTVHRYTRPEVREMFRTAGLTVLLDSYANTFLFPVAFLRRFVKRFGLGRGTDVKPLPASLTWIDPIFRNVLAAEAPILGSGRSFPVGLSAICYGKK